MAHLQSLLRMRGSPRIDVATCDEKSREAQRNIDMLLSPEFAAEVAGYFENYFAEVRPMKSETRDGNKVSSGHKARKAERGDMIDPRDTSWEDIRHLLQNGGEEPEESFGARAQMVGISAVFPNMRDWREPYPGGTPSRNQPCAQFTKGAHGADNEHTYCGKSFHMECVAPGAEVLREGSPRPNLFRIWLQGNCRYINNYNPLPPYRYLETWVYRGRF